MLTDFQTSFAGRRGGKFATNSRFNILPHLMIIDKASELFRRFRDDIHAWGMLAASTL